MNAEQFRQLAQQNIFPGESGGDYNALFGYQNREGGRYSGTRLTDMTVNQALDFSRPSGDYGQYVKGQVGRVATPMGAYQVVGTTLRGARDGLGLTGNEVMTPEMQDRIGQWIYETQGPGAWEGWSSGSGSPQQGQPSRPNPQATVSTRGAPQMAQEQAPQGILGALGLQRRQEGAAGPTGQRFTERDNFKDLMGNLASGFNSMRLNPDQGLDRRVQGQQQGRRDANQKNRTVEWLRSQPNGERFASMADSVGVGPALQAYQAAQQGADPVNGINVGGNLVNPRTGELMYQGAGDAVSPSSAIAKLQSDLSAGLINQDQYELGVANMAPPGFSLALDGEGGVTFVQGAGAGASTDAPTERQSSLALFGNLMDETMPEIAALESSETFNPASLGEGAASKAGWLGNYLRSPEGQRYEGLQRQWAEGVLRIQTGAAATQDEIDRVMSTYFPQPGDTAETVAQKSQQRDAFARSLVPASGGNIEAPGGAGTRGRIGEAPAGGGVPQADLDYLGVGN